ncbi:MAG: hypothetical protein WD898_03655 [Candidatus Paceibacterota bacterium]
MSSYSYEEGLKGYRPLLEGTESWLSNDGRRRTLEQNRGYQDHLGNKNLAELIKETQIDKEEPGDEECEAFDIANYDGEDREYATPYNIDSYGKTAEQLRKEEELRSQIAMTEKAMLSAAEAKRYSLAAGFQKTLQLLKEALKRLSKDDITRIQGYVEKVGKLPPHKQSAMMGFETAVFIEEKLGRKFKLSTEQKREITRIFRDYLFENFSREEFIVKVSSRLLVNLYTAKRIVNVISFGLFSIGYKS